MTDDLNNALNAITSLGSSDGFSSDPALYSQVGDSSAQDNLHHSGMPDFNQHHGVEAFSFSSGFDGSGVFDNNQADYSWPESINPDYPQSDSNQSAGYGDSFLHGDRGYDLGDMGQHEHHSFSVASQHQVMQCSSSHSNCPSTTIDSYGHIEKHTSDGSTYYVGNVEGRSIYNLASHCLGYGGTDGKVYDNHDHCVGWVDGCHVYNRGGVEVYETTKGVVGAAAYLLCVYYGGVN